MKARLWSGRQWFKWAALGYSALLLGGALLGAEITLRSKTRWVKGEFVPLRRRGNVVLLPASVETTSRGLIGAVPLLPNRGHALLGPPSRAGTLVRREVLAEHGAIPGDSLAWVSSFVYNGTPGQLDVPYENVVVHTPVGQMPAWHVKATSPSQDIVIVVHGHGGQRAQALRMLGALQRSGAASLFVTFRNAYGAPKVNKGYHTLGDKEAEDVLAALTWAREAGYTRALLYGFSMGGNTVLCALHPRYQPYPIAVVGVTLDSPALDWRDAIFANARRAGAPRLMARQISRFVQWTVTRRSGQDFDAVDQLAAASSFTLPMLLFHGTRDRTIPVQQSDALVAARPDLVEYHRVEGAKHIRCWNLDPQAYDAALERFIQRLFPPVGQP